MDAGTDALNKRGETLQTYNDKPKVNERPRCKGRNHTEESTLSETQEKARTRRTEIYELSWPYTFCPRVVVGKSSLGRSVDRPSATRLNSVGRISNEWRSLSAKRRAFRCGRLR